MPYLGGLSRNGTAPESPQARCANSLRVPMSKSGIGRDFPAIVFPVAAPWAQAKRRCPAR